MVEEEFDDFDDGGQDLDEANSVQSEVQDVAPQPAPQRTRPRPPQRRQQPPQPQMTPQMAASSAVQMPPQQANPQQPAAQARYVPYEMPKRIGLLDRVTGKPIIEDEDMLRVVMAQLADIKNDLEEIKSYYS